MKKIVLLLTVILNAAVSPRVFADSYAPIGVFDESDFERGEWKLSYLFTATPMKGSLSGSNRILPDAIATGVSNRFFGLPMQPPTLRVVPVEMSTFTHTFSATYAPTDRIAVIASTAYIRKKMDHITYQGATGTDVLGEFTTRSDGLGDTSITGLFGILDRSEQRLYALLGLSLPTGDIDETDTTLTPENTQPSQRLPYPMQPGSGTYDPIVGASYTADHDSWRWGGRWRSVYRIADNDRDYHLGNEHRLTGWASYLWSDRYSSWLRLDYYRRGNLSGSDPEIVAPVQTADPDR